MDDDEDSFLYGESIQPIPPPAQKAPVTEVISVLPELASESNGIVTKIEPEDGAVAVPESNGGSDGQDEGEAEEEEDEEEEEEDSEEDIEFIMEPQARSLDFRSQRGGHRPTTLRTPSTSAPAVPPPQTNLTTEYTPRERGAPAVETPKRQTSQAISEEPARQTSATPSAIQPTAAQQPPTDDGPDTSGLPPARAPPSHPAIDPSIPGTFEGRSVFDIDMTNLDKKPWRRQGSDLSDWFNYGFDEISWEAYCYRRRDMGELAGVMKANVINFAGMPEEQLLALPPEVRTMIMTGTNAMMGVNAAAVQGGPGGPPGMMPPGVGMNPMMAEMGQMGGMPMGMAMGMGMNGDMGMQMGGPGVGVGPGPGGMMPDGPSAGIVNGPVPGPSGPPGGPGQSGALDQGPGGQMNMQDGFNGGPNPMMGMNMGGDFNMQDGNPMGQQQMFPTMEGSATPVPAPVPVAPARGMPPAFRGRVMGPRGRGQGFVPRGRGRGFAGPEGIPQQLPVRPASPLPPNVPTGPRNPGNRYKDRDNNAPAVDGLDYGGTNNLKDSGSTPSVEPEEKGGRKRRGSPNNEEDRRSTKRR